MTEPKAISPLPLDRTELPDDPVTRYATDVLEGKVVAGRLVRLACQRHLNDLATGAARGLTWDKAAAIRAIQFFPDVLILPEIGSRFVLQGWQKFIVGSLFGWKRADGFRRFRLGYVEVGKGNGKSPLAGGIGLYMMAADGEREGQCYAAATTQEQAHILFQDAVKMVLASPVLRARIQTSGTRKIFNLAHPASGSFFRPISSEHRGLDGKRVHYAALDEVHEHPSSIVVDKVRAGTKGRKQALVLETTNAGYDRTSICWRHHVYSEQVLQGVLNNDNWFAFIAALDEGDDYRDPKVWIKPNPNLGISIPLKYIEDQVEEAAGIPGKENIVKRLNFCIWTEQATRWMPMEKWDACAGTVDADALAGQACYGGLDLALTRDLSAFVLIFPPNGDRLDWKILVWFWCAEEDIRERSLRDHVPYDVWAQQGFITATPGNITDHDFIETAIKGLREKYQIKEIGFDRALAAQLVTHLIEEGLPMTAIPQGALTMNAPIKTLEKLLIGKLIAHGGHPILRWNCANAALRQDSNGNVKFDKERSTERIDGMTALATAFVRAVVAPTMRGSVYDEGTFWKTGAA